MRFMSKLVLLLASSAVTFVAAGDLTSLKSRKIYQVLTDRFNNPSSSAGCSNLSSY